ncbi:MAG: 4Fe-4S binding protein [Marinifilaceae bacterium]|jgi:ferredoxin|nr:4Fe-4S binding protein [Marinifilaceae bacterium]
MSASYYMKKGIPKLSSGKNSRNAVIIPLMILQYGSLKAKYKAMSTTKPLMVASIKNLIKSAKSLKHNKTNAKAKIDQTTLDQLESYAKELSVSQIAYTKINPNYIYKGFHTQGRYAMMLTMNMDKLAIKSAPSLPATEEIWRTYASLGDIVNKLADFLRQRNYNCHPSPAIGGDVVTPPMGQDAGLGALGKNGLLITPEFGPSQRLAALFLDFEGLPIKTPEENKHLWIKDFCETCNRCVDKCPGNAILKQTRIESDGHPTYINREKCAPMFSKNCCTCIAVCPFINGNYQLIKKAFEKKQAIISNNQTQN